MGNLGLKLVLIFLMLAGATSVFAGVYVIRLTHGQKANLISLPGEITEMQPERHRKGTSYRPVVRFIDPEGQQKSFKAQVAGNSTDYRIGEKVHVSYNRFSRDATIDSIHDIYGPGIILIAVGVLFWIMSFVFSRTDSLKGSGPEDAA